jgi:hypothetical protein
MKKTLFSKKAALVAMNYSIGKTLLAYSKNEKLFKCYLFKLLYMSFSKPLGLHSSVKFGMRVCFARVTVHPLKYCHCSARFYSCGLSFSTELYSLREKCCF